MAGGSSSTTPFSTRNTTATAPPLRCSIVDMSRSSRFRFGPFELDSDREELRKGGQLLRLPHQPFRVLLLLVRAAGEVVTREEIHREIWGEETYVDFEQGINAAIRQIRFALSDHADVPRYVRTVPRRGYSFIAPVSRETSEVTGEAAEAAEHEGQPFRWKTAAAVMSAVAALMLAAFALWHLRQPERTSEPRTIAVLPFRVIGNAPDGIDVRTFGEELRATLATLPRRHIAVLDSSAPARAHVTIQGTIQRVPSGVRVIVRGNDERLHTQLWSRTYDRPLGIASGLSVEVAHRVMCVVAEQFLPPARHEARLLTNVSPRARSLYRRGRIERNRSLDERDWTRAKELYEAALREEPRFAEAWSALSDLWIEQVHGVNADQPAAVREAAACARRALALQPANAEARTTLGLIAYQWEYDFGEAEEAFRRATLDDPDYYDAHVNLAMVLASRGRFDDALNEYAVARELDPGVHHVQPLLYFLARRYDDALAGYRDMLVFYPDSVYPKFGLFSTYVAQENWAEAIAAARAMTNTEPARTDLPPSEQGFRAICRTVQPAMDDAYRQGRFDEYHVALFYAELRDDDRALLFLERAIEGHSAAISFILVDPRFDRLRPHERFQSLLARLTLGKPNQEKLLAARLRPSAAAP